jgi:hypothetical protein
MLWKWCYLTTNQVVGSSNLSERAIKNKGLADLSAKPFLFLAQNRIFTPTFTPTMVLANS